MFDYHAFYQVPDKEIKRMKADGIDIEKLFDVKNWPLTDEDGIEVQDERNE